MTIKANWSYPTAIRFGAGRISEIADACHVAGITKPLLVTDRGLANMDITTKTLDLLEAAGLGRAMFSDVDPNPNEKNAEAGVNAYFENGPHILNASVNTWLDPTWFLTDFGRGQLLAPSVSAGYRLRFKWFEAQLEYKILNPTRELQIPQNYIPSTSGLGGRGMYWGIAINF